MIAGIKVKVCGLTSLVDAGHAEAAGADYLGMVLHPASPRHVTLAQFAAMRAGLGGRRLVGVCVTPAAGFLERLLGAGADYVQVHAPHDTDPARVEAWAREAGAGRLWLAPRVPPGQDGVPAAWLALAGTFLLDTFDKDRFGGTGRTGDWGAFVRHRTAHPGTTWILSGGLSPDNIGQAVAATGARFIDVNSGVESAPGIKDPVRLRELRARLEAAIAASRGA